jgi:hypothetical protein
LIDAEGRVIDQHRAPEEPEHQAGPSADQEAEPGEEEGRGELEQE